MIATVQTLFALAIVAVVFGLLAIGVLRKLLYICGPNEVLVFSGTTSIVGKRRVGYRLIKGGRGLRKPLVERVDRMDLTNMTVEVTVQEAFSKGGIPLTVQGVANLKVAGHQPVLDNALQRFLGRSRKEIAQVAKDTLEGNLRGVLSQLTPEEVNEDKLAFAEKLLDEAEHDLTRLGLALDVLKIQNVSDDVGYLDCIGRTQSADVLRKARIAEAKASAESAIRDAQNRQRAAIAQAEARLGIVKAQVQRRITNAITKREALIAEEVGKVQAAVAKALAEVKVQEARIEQVRRQLEADVVTPARADMEKMQAEAKARAAKVIENGKATAKVLEEMIAAWNQGGDNARDIFLLQKLQTVMGSLVETIRDLKVDELILLPGDGGHANRAATLVQELKAATGIDLRRIAEGVSSRSQP